jgi:hypothetical protein
MPDLTTALNQELAAQTPETVPPFAEVRRRARKRARTRMALGAVAAAVVVAGGGVLAVRAVDGGPAPSPEALSSAAPQWITVNGRQLKYSGGTPVDNAWVDEQDPSILVVVAGVVAPDEGSSCRPYVAVRLLEEDAHTIRIAADEYQEPIVTRLCTQPAYPGKEHQFKLRAPVGGRTLLDGTTAVLVHDPGTVLSPSYLPPGFSQPGRVTWGDAPPGRLTGHTNRFYMASSGEGLSIEEADPAAEEYLVSHETQPSVFRPEAGLDVVGHPTVRGYAGVLFAHSPASLCLRWRESAELAVVVCLGTGRGVPPPDEDLLKVAESLHRNR